MPVPRGLASPGSGNGLKVESELVPRAVNLVCTRVPTSDLRPPWPADEREPQADVLYADTPVALLSAARIGAAVRHRRTGHTQDRRGAAARMRPELPRRPAAGARLTERRPGLGWPARSKRGIRKSDRPGPAPRSPIADPRHCSARLRPPRAVERQRFDNFRRPRVGSDHRADGRSGQ